MTAFLIGLGIGAAWIGAAIIVAVWFHRATADNFQSGDETGTEFPMHRNSV